MPLTRPVFVILALAIALTPPPAIAQSPTDHIHGRVRNDSSRAIAGANVFVTRGPDRAVKQTTTDSVGAYEIAFENGTGDYLIAVSAAGFKSVRRRVQKVSNETDFTADFVLQRDQATLAAVNITANRPVRASNVVSQFSNEAGTAERWSEGVSGQLPPSLAGSISASLGAFPGLTMGPGGATMLGASSESNLTTLNGMSMPGGSLPRAARTETRVTGATFDPTRGGFSGANVDVRLAGGSRFYQQRNLYGTLEPGSLAFTDATGRSLGARVETQRFSGGADGELIRQALTYNVSVDYANTKSTPPTLLAADPSVYASSGIAADSVVRARTVAAGLGLPSSGRGVPATRDNTAVTWLGRFDDTRDSLDTRTLTTIYGHSKSGGNGFGALAMPSAAGETTTDNAGVQVQLGTYFGPGRRILNQTRVGLSQTQTTSSPYVDLPGANVRVATTGAAAGIANLVFGGNSALDRTQRRSTFEVTSETVWNASGRKHVFKAAVSARTDVATQDGGADLLGHYSFNSLDDFAAGRPASYSRTLTNPGRSGGTWNAAAAFAHSFGPSRFFSLMYGARLEADGFFDAPARNVALENALGVATGVAPSRLHLSPRIGFTFQYNRDRDNGNGMSMNQVGRFFRPAAGTIRGGIGEFRDLLSPDLAADLRARTGLAGSMTSLSCVGAAVPFPDWNAFTANPSSVPSACAGGGVLADAAPPVSLLDRSYDVPRTWRASVDWNTVAFGWMQMRMSLLGTFGLNQPGQLDANFAGTQRLTLAQEGNRPVYVSAAAIDAASGAVSPTESRRASAFGRVGVRVSDLRNYGGQATIALTPDLFRARRIPGQLFASVAYTLQGLRREYRGFDGAAFGDPRAKEWAADPTDARHIFVVQGGFNTAYSGTVTFFGRFQSGLPFTPIVQGDVNGDGRSGDRAFVPTPSSLDPAAATQLSQLQATGSDAAKSCLAAFMGRVADRNGCRGPWTATLNAQWNPPLPSFIRRRFTTTLYFANLPGALDQMLHGADDLRGWGSTVSPDPVLLIPRSFDSGTSRFHYDVNPRFAETRASRTTIRDPFRVTIDFSLNMSVDFDLQSLRRALEPVRVGKEWQRRTADSLTTFYLNQTSDIFLALISESDSLFLSKQQVASLRGADSAFTRRVNAIYAPLGTYLSQFKDGVATKEALDSVAASQKAFWKAFWEQPEVADSLITPIQRDLMPMLKNMLQVPKKEREHSQWSFGNHVRFIQPDPAEKPKARDRP